MVSHSNGYRKGHFRHIRAVPFFKTNPTYSVLYQHVIADNCLWHVPCCSLQPKRHKKEQPYRANVLITQNNLDVVKAEIGGASRYNNGTSSDTVHYPANRRDGSYRRNLNHIVERKQGRR